MTLNEAIDSMLNEEKDGRKIKCLENLSEFLAENRVDNKIDGRKLFNLVGKLVKEWPEFVTVLVALSFLASGGLSDPDIDPKEIGNIDLSDFIAEE